MHSWTHKNDIKNTHESFQLRTRRCLLILGKINVHYVDKVLLKLITNLALWLILSIHRCSFCFRNTKPFYIATGVFFLPKSQFWTLRMLFFTLFVRTWGRYVTFSDFVNVIAYVIWRRLHALTQTFVTEFSRS